MAKLQEKNKILNGTCIVSKLNLLYIQTDSKNEFHLLLCKDVLAPRKRSKKILANLDGTKEISRWCCVHLLKKIMANMILFSCYRRALGPTNRPLKRLFVYRKTTL